eukprot:CAMPEP_0202896830 /NCGR_PEP_ID=MMETSP1392-20130828/5745_1 /ASSEMBLY_ACC=CAM_ASM_000868 /TAXON_ID=225041 /ORGANISM="Chlamydomonas chlamydogama, Strain SAG 11-48b" /LENGTH=576 /DNA_ID=CAMNT_0049582313 /DNA_START=156 /DNA_END=1886 /DNA_ORIENTATION=+
MKDFYCSSDEEFYDARSVAPSDWSFASALPMHSDASCTSRTSSLAVRNPEGQAAARNNSIILEAQDDRPHNSGSCGGPHRPEPEEADMPVPKKPRNMSMTTLARSYPAVSIKSPVQKPITTAPPEQTWVLDVDSLSIHLQAYLAVQEDGYVKLQLAQQPAVFVPESTATAQPFVFSSTPKAGDRLPRISYDVVDVKDGNKHTVVLTGEQPSDFNVRNMDQIGKASKKSGGIKALLSRASKFLGSGSGKGQKDKRVLDVVDLMPTSHAALIILAQPNEVHVNNVVVQSSPRAAAVSSPRPPAASAAGPSAGGSMLRPTILQLDSLMQESPAASPSGPKDYAAALSMISSSAGHGISRHSTAIPVFGVPDGASSAGQTGSTSPPSVRAYRTVAHVVRKIVPGFKDTYPSDTGISLAQTRSASQSATSVQHEKAQKPAGSEPVGIEGVHVAMKDGGEEQAAEATKAATAHDKLAIEDEQDKSDLDLISPGLSTGVRKRKAEAQVFPEDEGHWAPDPPAQKKEMSMSAGTSATTAQSVHSAPVKSENSYAAKAPMEPTSNSAGKAKRPGFLSCLFGCFKA